MKDSIEKELEQVKESAAKMRTEVEELYGKKVKPMFVPVTDANGKVETFALAWLKPMNKQVLGQFMVLDRTNPLGAQELVLKGLVIKERSDARILDDVNHFEVFTNALQTLMSSPLMAAYAGTVGE
jgi:hypothetical protein